MNENPTAWKSVTVERTGHVAQVTLIGPGKGNAMGPDFWAELPQVFEQLDADREVRAIVLTGAGEVVTTGPDSTDHADLYRGFPNSYGTLGYSTRLKIELEQVKPYVELRHLRFTSIDRPRRIAA